MPWVDSTYPSPRLLHSAHLATILPALLPGPAAAWTRQERLELPDGDFLDLVWRKSGHSRLAILSHGLEGSRDAPYIRGMAASLAKAGWDVLAWNYRSCGGIPNRLPRSYHSGESGDLRHLIAHAAPPYAGIALIGFSLGGNITLKYAGEAQPHPAVRAAVAISAPVDLASSARALDHRWGNRLYLRRFLQSLLTKAAEKARRFPESLDPASLRGIRTIRDFDEKVTAPLHGFEGAEDYWSRASSLSRLAAIGIPALLLNARNDPLLDQPSFPTGIAANHNFLTLEAPAHGGHVGFLDLPRSLRPWHEQRVVQFLNRMA